MASLDFGRSGAPLAGIVLCSALLKTAEPGQSPKIAAPVLALHGSRDVVSPLAVVQDLTSEMDLAGNDLRVGCVWSDTPCFLQSQCWDRSVGATCLLEGVRPGVERRDCALS